MNGIALLWLAGCGGEERPPPPSSDPSTELEDPCGPGATWSGFGQGFLLSYCTACHAESVTGDLRHGAPDGVDFDTLENTRTWAERIRVRTLETQDMPPAGGPLDDERTLFETWLDCGLPGTENPLPSSETPEDLVAAYALQVIAEEIAGEAILTRNIELPNNEDREGLLRVDRYNLSGDTAHFLGYETYDVNGEELFSVHWDPPLKLITQDQQDTTAHWRSPEGEGELQQTWYQATNDTPDIDGHVLDPDSWELTLTEEGGEQHGWVLSDSKGVVAQWALRETEFVEFQQLSTGSQGIPESDFPLIVEQPWLERALVIEVSP